MKCFGFTTGIFSGLLLGVLLAPEKGEETRKKLAEQAAACKRKLDNLFGTGDQALADLKEVLEDETAVITEEARKKLLKLVKGVQRRGWEPTPDTEAF